MNLPLRCLEFKETDRAISPTELLGKQPLLSGEGFSEEREREREVEFGALSVVVDSFRLSRTTQRSIIIIFCVN